MPLVVGGVDMPPADVAGDPTFEALVERVRGAAVETFAHQDVPFAAIVAAVHPERSRGPLPVFQVAFNFHHAPYPEPRLGDATFELEAAPEGKARTTSVRDRRKNRATRLLHDQSMIGAACGRKGTAILARLAEPTT
jgi:non-ribosomal peptide synthetase component F